MIKIGFIEDNKVYLSLLTKAVKMEPKITTLLTAVSVEDFFEKLPHRANLDIIFVDIHLPGLSGIDVLPKLRNRFKKADLVIISESTDRELLLRALSNGATGFLVKGFPITALPEFIHTIQNGGALVSPLMVKELVGYFNPPASNTLSSKETKILQFLADGQTYKSIASILDISVNGVKYYIKNIYKKLNVTNKVDAINYLNNSKRS
jgi:DNA-binding NarL/FixJ family response regulator